MRNDSPPEPLRANLKREWMLSDEVTFLNHGSFGSVPRVVFEEHVLWQRRIEADPIEVLGRRSGALLAEARGVVGRELGMSVGNFGFVTNATEGVNAVLRSLRLGRGEELLATSHVYGAVRQAMTFVAERSGAVYREFEVATPVASEDVIVGRVLEEVSEKTKLLVIDHVTSPTALVFAVERIVRACGERGVDVLVDGAHAPGMLALDVERIGAAYYAGNLHKWVCAPKGSGFLWVRPDRQAGIHPLVVSHYFKQGFEKELSWQGTRDLGAWLTVPRAFEFFAELGWERVREHNNRMARWALGMLCERWGVDGVGGDEALLGSMCTVALPKPLDGLSEVQIQKVQQSLYSEHRLEVPVFNWQGRTHVRPCAQVYNTASEYERLGEVILRMGRE